MRARAGAHTKTFEKYEFSTFIGNKLIIKFGQQVKLFIEKKMKILMKSEKTPVYVRVCHPHFVSHMSDRSSREIPMLKELCCEGKSARCRENKLHTTPNEVLQNLIT